MKITKLIIQKHNPDRINVYIDDDFAFGVSRFVGAWLDVGQEIEAERIEGLLKSDSEEKAYQRAINFISYRPRSEQEVKQNLIKHKVDNLILLAVIDRLKSNQLIDDLRFSQEWVQNRCEFKPRSKRALVYELSRKGVKPSTFNPVLEELDDLNLARTSAEKQHHKYTRLDWKAYQKKMTGFLSRRGFNYEICRQITEEIWNANGSNHSNANTNIKNEDNNE